MNPPEDVNVAIVTLRYHAANPYPHVFRDNNPQDLSEKQQCILGMVGNMKEIALKTFHVVDRWKLLQ